MSRPLAVSLALAAASLAVVDPAPSYDPWAWLLWGRELAAGELSTSEGPAFKPLPVLVCALLAPSGDAAPWLWVGIARWAALFALWMAFRLGRELAGGSVAGGALAAVGVALTGSFLGYAASGVAEGMLLALALAAVDRARHGRPRMAMALAVGCGLVRVETWPFLLAAGAVAWQRHPRSRTAITAAAVAVPAAWFLPELAGSGDLLRSGERAMIPNPGQPALADVPALASLRQAIILVPWPLAAGLAALACLLSGRAGGALASARGACLVAAAGGGWIAIVASMSQIGFSGEPRYAMPGAALLSIAGAAGITLAARTAGLAVARRTAGLGTRSARAASIGVCLAAMGIVAVGSAPRVAAIPAAQAYQWRLATDLSAAVAAAGGRAAVLECGIPYVGRLRGPLMAYQLDVEKRDVEPDDEPRRPGVAFRSALTSRSRPVPDIPAGFSLTASAGLWDVHADCGGRRATVPS